MGIFDRFRHKAAPPAAAPTEPPERVVPARDEAADAFGDQAERARDDAERRIRQEREDREAAANMTSEGDPWS
ncbi:hypothetical protein [Kitasatospora phosalacinea]|uniref:Uncharacterized protein n=1 Tax=Kitasatospora phosalacinea TaxID=2065 RepID=A0A9W6PPK7_9ACTN|nr:hypothetical protein [Kitasatospora phosalacinea]GLW58669.1 hypothetical protein Kpho01_66800 [Kitasatospora phosalacinea]